MSGAAADGPSRSASAGVSSRAAADSASLRVGFAGIGRMGLPMARNVLDAGFPLAVFNRTPERCDPLVEAGATLASTPAELAAASDVVITMVADGDAVRALLDGPDGLLAGAAPGLVLAEMSTIGPLAAREVAERCAEAGVAMLDAPVSGSIAVADAGALTILVGGDAEALERARPALDAMSKAVIHIGPSGAGAAIKLAINLIIGATVQSVSEALVVAESSGIEREAAYEAIASSVVGSTFVDYKRDAWLDPDGTPTAFTLELMLKDLGLALELGEATGVPLRSTAAAVEGTERAIETEGGDADQVRIADALRRVRDGATKEEERA
jgi:3-hydroxyisobutyrate dehydrogenase-like beta-hydroxyacid dehydrogenase